MKKNMTIIILLIISAIVGLVSGGYIISTSFSAVDISYKEKFVVGYGQTVAFNNHIITSKDMTFYIDNEPIYMGQEKYGILLGHKSADGGLFIVKKLSKTFTVSGTPTGYPGPSLSISPSSPKASEAIYFHASGDWDGSANEYKALTRWLENSVGNELWYKSTVTRTYTGSYNTKGGSDTATNLVGPITDSLSSGNYDYKGAEWYQGGKISDISSKSFTVADEPVKDTTLPSIRAYITPESTSSTEGEARLTANVYDYESGVKRVWATWSYRSVSLTGTSGSYTVDIPYVWFSKGSNDITVYAENGNGLRSSKTVTFTIIQTQTTTPPPQTSGPPKSECIDVAMPKTEEAGYKWVPKYKDGCIVEWVKEEICTPYPECIDTVQDEEKSEPDPVIAIASAIVFFSVGMIVLKRRGEL
jgi:hypothetical protein